MDWVKTVNKLKSKLHEAAGHDYQESAVKKILHRLGTVPMTLEVLQVTHIGKEVNGLRKIDGEVGKTAKQLVKSWKQLLADVTSLREKGDREGESQEEEAQMKERGRKGKHKAREGGEEEERQGHSQAGSQALHCSSASHDHLSPSLSLLTPPTSSREHASTSPLRQNGEYGSSQGHASGEEGQGSQSTPPAGYRKRKAVLDRSVDAVAHTKKSRTQVYSGKKSTSGPQTVMSLFEMSMKVLIDNIDAIEEVGGVPYFILEPLLQKCTVTQLLRLEEFNPHFLDESGVLWEKHCLKDFKGCRPQSQQSWRELYLSKLSEREQRLKSITASIRRKEEARKEPVRQVKLAVATRAPGRRRQIAMPLPSRPSQLYRSSLDRPPTNISKLKKQTMKMVKERSMMSRGPAKR